MSTQGPVGATPDPARSAPAAPASASAPAAPSAPAAHPAPSLHTGAVRIPSVTVSTGSVKIVIDPARREDVLFRVRREENHEISAWWMIGAFVGVSAAVIALLNFVPG